MNCLNWWQIAVLSSSGFLKKSLLPTKLFLLATMEDDSSWGYPQCEQDGELVFGLVSFRDGWLYSAVLTPFSGGSKNRSAYRNLTRKICLG